MSQSVRIVTAETSNVPPKTLRDLSVWKSHFKYISGLANLSDFLFSVPEVAPAAALGTIISSPLPRSHMCDIDKMLVGNYRQWLYF